MRKETWVLMSVLTCAGVVLGCGGFEVNELKGPRAVAVKQESATESPIASSKEAPTANTSAVTKPVDIEKKQPPKPLLSADEIADGWIQLFDGETLFGWKPNSDVNWSVADSVSPSKS